MSLVAGWFKGAPSSFQSGMSSLRAVGSITAPDRICAPAMGPDAGGTAQVSQEISTSLCTVLFERVQTNHASKAEN